MTPDLTRIERARTLLAQGATERPGPADTRQLVLDGRPEMTTSRAVLREARRPLDLLDGAA